MRGQRLCAAIIMPTASKEQDEYNRLKKELKDLLNKKRNMERSLGNLEENIFRLEGIYLEETNGGNVVKGFDNYLKSSQNKRRATLYEDDRIFSMSSTAFLRSKTREEDVLY